MKDEAPNKTKKPAFTFRQRGVLSTGVKISKPVTVPVVKICVRISTDISLRKQSLE
jgi:hypothetical protein